MARLISARTVTIFINLLSDHFVLRDIADLFKGQSIPEVEDYESSYTTQRRALADRYLQNIDFTYDFTVSCFLGVVEDALTRLELQKEVVSDPSDIVRSVKLLEHSLSKDGFNYSGGVIHRIDTVKLNVLEDLTVKIDAHYIRNQVHRLQATVDQDPEAAIGGAKELIESCCKTILSDTSADFDKLDVPKLVKECLTTLKLTPDDVPETARGKDSMKKLLGSLGTVAISLAELRNEYGSGHGKHGKTSRPKPRHARLAVSSAAALATFLLETHELQLGRNR